ncbi:MAG TPA: ribosome-recycling factor, partial [Symbiobacteriaceae bacterium]|nr:ribosome-recycling factor [Symbiobacteriaceae bacterium]
MTKQIVKDAEEKMKKSIEVFRTDLAGMKAGRATPALLDKIRVDYYGTPSPIKQVAAVEVSDSRTLTIKPYERNMIKAIEKAIQQSDLGINPNNDGIVIRLQIPAMTEDRRKEMVKVVHKRTEE